MKSTRVHTCLRWIAVVALCLSQYAQATPTDRIIIKINDTMRSSLLADGGPALRAGERVAGLSAAAGHDVAWLRAMSGGADVLRLPRALTGSEVEAVAAALAKLPGVEYAEPDRRMFPARVPNDPRFGEQWHLQAVIASGQINYGIDAPAAWDITIGDAVTVAVLDTGVLFAHADLRGKVLPGYDFISLDSAGVFRTANDGDGRDPGASDTGDWVTVVEATDLGCEASNSSWHGTHVAGTIAAATDNGVGVAGINWRAMILPLRVLGKCGGYTSDIIDAMRWATGVALSGIPQNPYPARILNLSLAAPGTCGITWQNAINDVNNRGAVVIVAAGNETADLDATPSTPAVCNGVLTVAASDRLGQRASYSNYGSAVDISAPGGATPNVILSTLDGGLTFPLLDSGIGARIGTSMATAHVSGAASLLLSRNPSLTRDQVFAALTGNATAFPASSNCAAGGCGSGIVNARLALGSVADAGNRPVNAFTFVPLLAAGKGLQVVSNEVAVDTGGSLLSVSVQGGEYSLGCTTSFTAALGTIVNGETVCLRHVASTLPAHSAATVVAVGNYRAAFASLTGPADTAPDPFGFDPVSEVDQGVTVTSETVTLSGIDAPAPVQVDGGSYSPGCLSTSFTTEPGYIAPGGTVCVRHVSSSTLGATTTTTLTVGGVSASFTSTTSEVATSSGGGGSPSGWLLAGLLGYAVLRRLSTRKPPQAAPASAP